VFKLKPTGITLRITLLSWTVTLATLCIFVAFIIPEQKRDLRAELQSKASGVAVALQSEVASATVSDDYSSVVDHAMQVLAGDKAVDFLVVTKNDGFSVIVDRTGWRTQEGISKEWVPQVRQPYSVLGMVPQFNNRFFHYAVPFDYNGIEWGWIHVGLSLNSYDQSSRQVYRRTGLLTVACVLLGLVVSVFFARYFVRPILGLQSVVEQIASGDLEARANIKSQDEIEQLANAFNTMADAILHRDQALSEAKAGLERRVDDRTQELREQIVAKDLAHAELADAQKRLIELSRLSGMAEVATGVLHNVGNVLNSVNVSATVVGDHLRESRIRQLGELVRLLQEHKSGMDDYLTNDPRGRRLLPYLASLSEHLEAERGLLGKEVASMAQHISHIKEIVATQQTYARSSGVFEKVLLTEVMEDVFGIAQAGMERHSIELQTEGEQLPPINTDRHKVLQILLNLLRNAKDAVKASGKSARQITVRMHRVNDERVAIRVADNGIGIQPANLVRIFSHGFTTKRDGHGFGLHSGALAAKQLGGSLSVESEGVGTGAIFTLELPINGASREVTL
jgi:signal transduction histidine kinase